MKANAKKFASILLILSMMAQQLSWNVGKETKAEQNQWNKWEQN